jgi:hypothetical protein
MSRPAEIRFLAEKVMGWRVAESDGVRGSMKANNIIDDHTLIARSFCRKILRWEPFAGTDGRTGELCFGGLRYCTSVDSSGIPILNGMVRERLQKTPPPRAEKIDNAR